MRDIKLAPASSSASVLIEQSGVALTGSASNCVSRITIPKNRHDDNHHHHGDDDDDDGPQGLYADRTEEVRPNLWNFMWFRWANNVLDKAQHVRTPFPSPLLRVNPDMFGFSSQTFLSLFYSTCLLRDCF